MKTAETKTTASNHQQQEAQATPQPFFQKDNEAMFFSDSQKDIQAFFKSSNSPFIQTKLNIGKPNDKYEVEADAVADRVVNQLAAHSGQASTNESSVQAKYSDAQPTKNVQRKEEEQLQEKSELDIQPKAIFESSEDNSMLQTKAISTPTLQTQHSNSEEDLQQKEEETESTENDSDLQKKPIFESGGAVPPEDEQTTIQQQTDSAGTASPSSSLESQLSDSKGGGQTLPKDTQSSMGSAMGADFSNVKVHTGSEAVQMNQDLGAQAFTHGSDIYFNEGKYDTGSSSGQHLLAHELAHTVQQGAAESPSVQKTEAQTSDPIRPTDPIDITHRFDPNEAWQAYLEAQTGRRNRNVDVDVKIGTEYTGTISVRRLNRRVTESQPGSYRLSDNRVGRYYLEVNGMTFLNPLRNAGVHPVLVLRPFGEEGQTTGFLSIRNGTTAVGDVIGLIRGLNAHLEAMQFLGLEPIEIPGGSIENTFDSGRLVFQIAQLTTVIDGFLEIGGGMGIVGSNFTFNLNTNINIEGLASGEFTLAREENGNLNGGANIQADIANVNASIVVEYLAGVITIQGTGRMQSEKFSGEITLLVTDRARSTQMMHAALGVQSMDTEAENPESPAAPKTPGNQVLVGWGEVTATITPWLEGTAKIGIDAAGHVTIVGELTVTEEVELMEQRGKKTDLFDVEIRAGYGIPLVGQVFLFASIGMFMNAGFGPLVLRDIRFEGTYSTDPSILQQFSITGSLGINAFAVLGLEAEAGVGLTLLGHDVKAGVNVTAAAGLRAYASATPTFEYVESQAPEGGKVGEAHLKGHFEAAAQLFLQLSGALFYELDSPWWSPAPDGREESPLGEVQYPIGDSMGIGADIDWLVGSPDVPDIKFSPVEFDPEQFTADVMADPPPNQRGNNEENPQGEWQDGSAPGNLDQDPTAQAGGEGLPGGGRQEENLRNLPDEQKYMRGLSEISDIAESREKPTVAVVENKMNRIKRRYGLNQVRIQTENDDHVLVFVSHARQDNSNNLINVPIMSVAERVRLLHEAMQDLTTRMNRQAGDAGTIAQADAQTLATAWHTAHPIIESVRVIDGQDSWDFQVDIGDRNERVPGKGKSEVPNDETELTSDEAKQQLLQIDDSFTEEDGDRHTIRFIEQGSQIQLTIFSTPISFDNMVTQRRSELNSSSDNTTAAKISALDAAVLMKNNLDTKVREYAANMEGSGHSITASRELRTEIEELLNQIADKLKIAEVTSEAEDLVPTNVTHSESSEGRAHHVVAEPLTKIPGNTAGTIPTQDPPGWDTIPEDKKNIWVRAHLLNHQLHGPGLKWNLTPGTSETNNNMKTEVENVAKDRVKNSNDRFYYEATVNYYAGTNPTKEYYKYFPRTIDIKWGELVENGGNYTRGRNLGRSFTQDPPSFDRLSAAAINESSASVLHDASKDINNGALTISRSVFSEIINVRRIQDNHSFSSVDELITAMNLHYVSQGRANNYFENRYATKLRTLISEETIFLNF